MGFFGKLFSAGPAMNRLAKACDETLNCLRRFDFTGDKDELYKAAWILHMESNVIGKMELESVYNQSIHS